MTCNCARFPKPHNKQRLCGIGFNEFLGEVQHRLILAGYAPPAWPDAKIRDQGDLDDALDSCVQWCAARLDALSEAEERVPEGMVLVPRKQIMGDLNDLEIGDYVEVRYKDGSGKVNGNITKLWVSPHAQAQVNNGWCFHPGDEITIHQRPSPTGDEERK